MTDFFEVIAFGLIHGAIAGFVWARVSSDCAAAIPARGGIMATKNDITGDLIQTRTVTQTYRDNYDLIFGNKNGRKNEKKTDETEPESVEDSPSQE